MTRTVSRNEALAEACDHIRAGTLDQASTIFRAVLDANPHDADAIHLLGVTYDTKGDPERAVELIRQALTLREMPSFHSNLGLALSHLGRQEDAVAEYRRAVEADPKYAEAWNNLGISLNALNRLVEAEEAFRAAVAMRPDYAEPWGNLGDLLHGQQRIAEAVGAYEEALKHNAAIPRTRLGASLRQLGRLTEAEAAFRAEVEQRPDSPEALNNLAAILGESDRIQEAASLLPRATTLRPDYAEAHANMGQVLHRLGRLEEAVSACEKALALRPDYPEALTNLGNALRELNRLAESETVHRRALALRPTDIGNYNNLAITLHAQDRPHEALAVADLAAALDPNDPETQHHRSIFLLRTGRFTEGWAAYESRLFIRQVGDVYKQYEALKRWNGEDVAGRTILLTPEQGLGDAIQFARYIPVIAAKGGRVVVGVGTQLARLMRSVDGLAGCVTAGETVSKVDLILPLMSSAGVLGTTLDTIPVSIPYLHPAPEDVALWAQRIGPREHGLRVGLVWAGNPQHPGDRHRSIPLSRFSPLWSVPGVRWFSLQVGESAGDLHAIDGPAGGIADLGPGFNDFGDTAAALQSLDLVIAVDTSVAHLAGALGRPVWTLLQFVGDWRWLRGRETTPWYPTMRLFRQDSSWDWAPVITRVAEALRRSVGSD